jgi:hypothetical protein
MVRTEDAMILYARSGRIVTSHGMIWPLPGWSCPPGTVLDGEAAGLARRPAGLRCCPVTGRLVPAAGTAAGRQCAGMGTRRSGNFAFAVPMVFPRENHGVLKRLGSGPDGLMRAKALRVGAGQRETAGQGAARGPLCGGSVRFCEYAPLTCENRRTWLVVA